MQLQVLTVLAHPDAAPFLKRQVLDGRLREALAAAEDALDARHPEAGANDESLCVLAQLCGDLMLAQDRAEEAEETYRLAVKLAGGARRGTVRVVSCRSTGYLSLYRQRHGTALACFARLAADEAATTAQRVEAHCAMAVAQQALGQIAAAAQALDKAGELACSAGDPDLAMLASLMRVDFAVARALRTHDALQDHVFWRPATRARVPERDDLQPLATLDICLAAHGHHGLVAQRLRHLRDLLRASYGEPGLQAALLDHLAQLRACGLSTLEQQARMDTALVALSQRSTELARSVLEPVLARDAAGSRRWSVELAFCQAKLSQLAGRVEEAMQYYQRYAFESMQCVRAGAAVPVERAAAPDAAVPVEARDDIEMRLPAKYRRAYRYLQSHLDCPGLTVREIADDMGVTERALQSAFKTYLGMTPGEIVQRCRVERIRADLLREGAPGTSVIETAARWGIRNRSTLIASYRKYFRETPTQTLARRGLQVVAAA
ncbi:MAG TPA: helix-turn-helix transcriptional regulator [Burkholderiaceae bacterium]